MEFKYAPMFQLGKDETEYYLLTKDHVSVSEFEGKPILKIEAEGLTKMANAAFSDVSFMLRRSHNEQVAKILRDPEASANDKYVALTSAKIPVLPLSTARKDNKYGLATAMRKPSQRVYISPIPNAICVTHKTLRSICMTR